MGFKERLSSIITGELLNHLGDIAHPPHSHRLTVKIHGDAYRFEGPGRLGRVTRVPTDVTKIVEVDGPPKLKH